MCRTMRPQWTRCCGWWIPYEGYLWERIAVHSDLSAQRLWPEVAELGYPGGYSTLTDFLCEVHDRVVGKDNSVSFVGLAL